MGIRAFPVYLIGMIYFPASLLGLIFFHDKESVELLLLILLFCLTYFCSYGLFSRIFVSVARKISSLINVSMVFWYRLSFIVFVIYVASLGYAVHLAEVVPLMVALKGGTLMDIAQARGQFLAGLEGYESLLRYAVFILGRSLMPLVLVAAFVFGSRLRYLLLIALLALSMLSLEKAAPVFIFLPCIFYYFTLKKWLFSVGVIFLMVASIGIMALLAMGGVGDAQMKSVSAGAKDAHSLEVSIPPGMPIQEAMGRPGRFFLPNMIQDQFGFGQVPVDANEASGKIFILLNRIVWIPYITAYDWLGFHRKILNGELTLGRSVSFIHHLYGEPKMLLEKMVYVYEFGPSPGGAGASNTAFFVDAKLAFGWAGVLVYCLIFTFCAACIFSSGSQVLMVSSVVCFFVASVSSLTATLLSGGLFIYVVLAFLLFDNRADVPALGKTGGDK
ncbi:MULTISPECIES: hypothetical protein [Pseudomonas]|uniref:hypothetical protein n=1 Tax=Pseudomonas TaxID=286 RepID=UPI001C65D1A8|nr:MULTISPECIES: hypothetical protein [unclassified Pseudomonas]MBW8126360.1 hypothetical protein [Pseudomonas sp. LAP_36]MBW8136025.1 hypothetical protein [Pseudomonas sp. PAMC 26818]